MTPKATIPTRNKADVGGGAASGIAGLPTRAMRWTPNDADHSPLITREWLVTNGLGGYASGTVIGVSTRRYHGLLIAAMPAPLGRMMLLNHVSEQLRLPDGSIVQLSGEERRSALF